MNPQPKALVLADALEELDVQFSHTGLCGEAADELRRLHVWEKAYEAVCDERDAIIRDSDKAHALLRWVEKALDYVEDMEQRISIVREQLQYLVAESAESDAEADI